MKLITKICQILMSSATHIVEECDLSVHKLKLLLQKVLAVLVVTLVRLQLKLNVYFGSLRKCF